MDSAPLYAPLFDLLGSLLESSIVEVLSNLNEQIPHDVLVEAERALDIASKSKLSPKALCDALRWITISGTITHVSAINVLLSPIGYYLTTIAKAEGDKERNSMSMSQLQLLGHRH